MALAYKHLHYSTAATAEFQKIVDHNPLERKTPNP